MDESVGMLSLSAVLVLGIWLVDYAGDSTRAAAEVRAASAEAASYTARAMSSPPSGLSDSGLDAAASGIAERIVSAATLGDCDTADKRYKVSAKMHRLKASAGASGAASAAVTVEVTCPLAVSPLFADVVRIRTAAPIPESPR